ncbi:hypothetical protein [Rhizobium leguminosarum]
MFDITFGSAEDEDTEDKADAPSFQGSTVQILLGFQFMLDRGSYKLNGKWKPRATVAAAGIRSVGTGEPFSKAIIAIFGGDINSGTKIPANGTYNVLSTKLRSPRLLAGKYQIDISALTIGLKLPAKKGKKPLICYLAGRCYVWIDDRLRWHKDYTPTKGERIIKDVINIIAV